MLQSIITMQTTTINLKCFDGSKHSGTYLQEIYWRGSDDEAISIKWCSVCGAIVGDIEVDGRLMGTKFPMEFPEVVKLRNNK